MLECAFLIHKRIDSFQKLGLVLWFDRRGDAAFAIPELADQIFIADLALLERTLTELAATGLVDCEANRYHMIHSPHVDYCLACLAVTFEDPLARQGLLASISALGGGHSARFE